MTVMLQKPSRGGLFRYTAPIRTKWVKGTVAQDLEWTESGIVGKAFLSIKIADTGNFYL